MTHTNCIQIEAARDLIAERSAKILGMGWLAASIAAWDLIAENLTSGDLPSLPTESLRFRFTLQTATGTENIPLNDDGTIPASFWVCFCDAAAKTPELTTQQANAETYAEKLGARFYFRDRGRDNGILEGEAYNVLVPRDRLPGNIPTSPGRPRGSVKYNNQALVQMAQKAIRTCEMNKAEAVNTFSAQMHGNATTENKKRQFRRLLSQADKNY